METKVSTSSQQYNFMQLGAQQGWQCPICKRILAPFVPECPCGGQGLQTWTTTSSTTDKDSNPNTLTMNEEDAKHIPTISTYYSKTGL